MEEEKTVQEVQTSDDALAATSNVISNHEIPQLLKWYYSNLFPTGLFYRWISYSSQEYFARREISFTLDGDVYLRWLSFRNESDFQSALKQRHPIKIDIGAVYNFSPSEKNNTSAPIVALEKELVFDVDMTDYESVMGELLGGSEVDICDRNWSYMSTAVKVIDKALRLDFGFQHILWVYSGRRGIHCWVADEAARKLTNEGRCAIVDYLSIRFDSKENLGKKQHDVTAPLHPALLRAKRDVCEPLFRDFVLNRQQMLKDDERVIQMISIIPDSNIRGKLLSRLTTPPLSKASGADKWDRIEKELMKNNMRSTVDYIIFHYTYPRLDINVSREINHLLKSPFCVHPKTGRVCVPFSPDTVESFLPGGDAPHIQDLLTDSNKNITNGNEVEGVTAEKRAESKLKASFNVFEKFLQGIEGEIRQKSRIENLKSIDRQSALEFVQVK